MDNLTQNLKRVGMVPDLRDELISYQINEPVSVRMNKGSGIEMTYRGVSLYDLEKPLVQAAAEVQRLQGEQEQDLIVFFGLGFGIHAEFLKKRFKAPLLIFEPSLDILKTTLSLRPLMIEDLSVETNFGRLAEIVDQRLELSDRRLIVAMHSTYKEVFPEQFERFKFVVQQAASSVMIRYNTLKRGGTWAEYEIENIRKVIGLPPITELKQYAKDVPGVFVGAGPSLSKNIHLIKEMKGKAIIIAASTALRPLDKAGVQPDVAMVIESNPSMYQFEGLGFLNDLTLAPTAFSHPDNFKRPVKYVMPLLNRPTPTHDWMTRAYGDVDAVVIAGSVALAAFSTLHSIGCDPIIALGMDLAFTEDQTHAKGADSAAEVARYNKEKQVVEYVVADADSKYFKEFSTPDTHYETGQVHKTRTAYVCDGWKKETKVFSDATFTSYRAWLEGAADTWASDRVLVNATEGGARIIGFQELSLTEVIKKYIRNDYPVAQWFEQINQGHSPRNIDALRKEIQSELSLLRRVNQLGEQSRSTALQAIGMIQSNKLNKAQQKLNTLETLEKEMGSLTRETRILNQISHQAATTIRLGRHQDKHDDMRIQTTNSLKRSIELFEQIESGCTDAIELFEQAMTNLSEG